MPDKQLIRGGIRLAPTSVTGYMLLATVGLIYLSATQKVSTTVPLVLGLLSAVDFIASFAILRSARVNVSTIISHAQIPNRLSFIVYHSPGTALKSTVQVQLWPLHTDDPLPEVSSCAPGDSATVFLSTSSGKKQFFVVYTVTFSMFGLATASRKEIKQLLSGLHCVPQSLEMSDLALPSSPLTTELDKLREYLPGDKANRVHWSAYAKTGTLLVRDEAPLHSQVTIVIDFSDYEPSEFLTYQNQLDLAAAQAMRVCEQIMQSESTLRLVTLASNSEYYAYATRRAVRKVKRTLPKLPKTSATETIDAHVVDRENLIERLAHPVVGQPIYPETPFCLVTMKGCKVFS